MDDYPNQSVLNKFWILTAISW